jgi:hypothetical protein
MEELSEETVLLRMLTAEPAKPTRNIGDHTQSWPNTADRVLSLADERVIVGNLAFLSAISDHREMVTAICLEEGVQSDCCTIRVAMNTDKVGDLLDGFRNFARSLETVGHKSEHRRSVSTMN